MPKIASKIDPTFEGPAIDANRLDGVVPPESGGTGANSLSGLKSSLSLNNVDNTSDANKPVSTATANAISTATTTNLNNFNTVLAQAQSARDEAFLYGSTIVKATWIEADELTGLNNNDGVLVLSADTDSHPSVTGDFGSVSSQTPNSGFYQYSATLGKLVRKSDLESALIKLLQEQSAENASRAEAYASAVTTVLDNFVSNSIAEGLADPEIPNESFFPVITSDGRHLLVYKTSTGTAGTTVEYNTVKSFEDATAVVEAARDEALEYGSSKVVSSWTEALDLTGLTNGYPVFVLSSDTGSHTSLAGDVGSVSGQTPNAGYYLYSTALAGLVRKANLESIITKTYRDQAKAYSDSLGSIFDGFVYQSTAEGLADADVPNNSFFPVITTAGDRYDVFKDGSGNAGQIIEYPTKAYMDSIKDTVNTKASSAGLSHSVVDYGAVQDASAAADSALTLARTAALSSGKPIRNEGLLRLDAPLSMAGISAEKLFVKLKTGFVWSGRYALFFGASSSPLFSSTNKTPRSLNVFVDGNTTSDADANKGWAVELYNSNNALADYKFKFTNGDKGLWVTGDTEKATIVLHTAFMKQGIRVGDGSDVTNSLDELDIRLTGTNNEVFFESADTALINSYNLHVNAEQGTNASIWPFQIGPAKMVNLSGQFRGSQKGFYINGGDAADIIINMNMVQVEEPIDIVTSRTLNGNLSVRDINTSSRAVKIERLTAGGTINLSVSSVNLTNANDYAIEIGSGSAYVDDLIMNINTQSIDTGYDMYMRRCRNCTINADFEHYLRIESASTNNTVRLNYRFVTNSAQLACANAKNKVEFVGKYTMTELHTWYDAQTTSKTDWPSIEAWCSDVFGPVRWTGNGFTPVGMDYATVAELTSAASRINTRAKVLGKLCNVTDTGKVVHADGTGSTGTWTTDPYILSGSKTHDWGSVASGSTATTTVTVTGATTNELAWAYMGAGSSGMTVSAQVTGANTVTVTITNNTGSPVDLSSDTLYARVMHTDRYTPV